MAKKGILFLLIIGLFVFVGCDGEIVGDSGSLGTVTIDEIISYSDDWGLDTAEKPYVHFGLDDTESLIMMDISAYEDDTEIFLYSVDVTSYEGNTITGTY